MTRKLITLLIVVALFISTFGGLISYAEEYIGMQIYVSPTGNDASSGTAQSPLRTLQGARSRVSSLRRSYSGNITVNFMEGSYQFTEAVYFGPHDGGIGDQTITYRALPGADVTFTGGQQIPGDAFTRITNPHILDRLYPHVRNRVLQVNLRRLGITEYGIVQRANPWTREMPGTTALFVDGFMQTLARWPNNDFALTGAVETSARVEGYVGGVFHYTENIPDRWRYANEIWLHGFWMWDWYDDSLRVEHLDIENRRFYLEQTTVFGIARGKRYFAFNLLEEIDIPGEWYLDRVTGILYFYPPYDLTNADVQLATLDQHFIRMNNTRNIIVEGITFENSRATGMLIEHSENILVRDSTFRNLGGQAIFVRGGYNNGIVGSNFHDLGKGAIHLYAGCWETLSPANHFVENCYFTRFALTIQTYAPAVAVDGVGFRIANNVMHNAPHSAVTSAAADVLMENNEVFDVCRTTHDAGAFYTGRDWTRQGNVIRNNFFHNIYGIDGQGAHVIYLDDAESGYTIYQNTFINIYTPIFNHGGHDMHFHNNTVINGINSITVIRLSQSRDNIVNSADGFFLMDNYRSRPVNNEYWMARWPHLANLMNEPFELPLRNVIYNNLTYNSPDVAIHYTAYPTGHFERNYTFNSEEHNVPFADPENWDFRLTEEIPELPGFLSTDMDVIGLMVNEDRSSLPEPSEFRLIYPYHGARNVVGNRLNLIWQPVFRATRYRVTVSTDRNFRRVVQQFYTYETSAMINGLEYGGTRYFWKVEAIGTSHFRPFSKYSVEGFASFRTAITEVLDKSLLEVVLDNAERLLSTAVIGDDVGNFDSEVMAEFLEVVEAARIVFADDETTTPRIDATIDALRAGIARAEATRVSGVVSMGDIIRNPAGWRAANPNFIRTFGDVMTFIPVGGVVAGYMTELPSYAIWDFYGTFDTSAGFQGFGFRAADATAIAWSTTSYLLIWGGGNVEERNVELHRFHAGGATLATVPTTALTDGVEHRIQLGAVCLPDGGVRIIFIVNGETIIDLEDRDGYIPPGGLLTIYGQTNRPLVLRAPD